MIPASLQQVRALIAQARARDPQGDQLSQLLHNRSSSLHTAIQLPRQQAPALLSRFVLRYIEQVPDVIEALADLTQEAGIYAEVEPLLRVACDYFVNPPSLIDSHSALETLLDEAYLAHRLLEEINDRFISLCGSPLAPMDMTRANIVVHALIGEPFATELDQAVLFSAQVLLDQHPFNSQQLRRYLTLHQTQGWSSELRRWPCLAEDLDIDVHFGHRIH